MPYEWNPPQGDAQRLHLWPYRSLPRRGMVWFIGITSGLIALPLLALLGKPHLWVMLPFLLLAVMVIWVAIQRSYKDGAVLETLILTETEIVLTRQGPRRAHHHWQANPHWVRVNLFASTGPVPNYLTLSGNQREVELGAFLTPEERANLDIDLRKRLAALRQPMDFEQ
jgi:uncharacterized membrane protein